ncbi:MAG: aspartate aminotransferase family protein [Chitinophagales bacterium]|nr:aspartate aminotransferase family protein [Chitinophagaceae bacterium]MCB9063688.1 aspartate aminotransferase family protein [Chitinophagales bacterium]
MNIRSLFLQHLAQTSQSPVGLHITSATGNHLIDADGKKYLDLIGGISVCNAGHSNPYITDAIKKQLDDYTHIMVYGELIQSPQVEYAQGITERLPKQLNSIYFTNSGTEATEGALKLARRVTGRTDVIACNNSYHGSTLGSLSVMGDEYWRNAYRPLLPGVWHYNYNSDELLNAINENTSCVLLETVQAEAGVIEPDMEWIKAVREKCSQTGALLILDEIQCGFGRTGKLWGFEHYDIVPDVILLGKALGGGMPLGAFVSSHENMQTLTVDPVLGHITTFGGHPVSCAAGKAAMDFIIREGLIEQVEAKGRLFAENLVHDEIKAVRRKGLLIAVELESNEKVLEVCRLCIDKGIFTDWFLFAQNCIRIAPPLTITNEDIVFACETLKEILNK